MHGSRTTALHPWRTGSFHAECDIRGRRYWWSPEFPLWLPSQIGTQVTYGVHLAELEWEM